jgi:predicted dehydrogenase
MKNDSHNNTLRVTISGTGFAGDFTAQVFRQIPHKNGVAIELAGVTSGHLGNAEKFAKRHGVGHAFDNHQEMLDAVKPHIDCIACANYAHAQYVREAAAANVPVIVLEKPPIIWPGYAEAMSGDAETRKIETLEAFHEVLEAVEESDSKLLYAENFTYVDGIQSLVMLMGEAVLHEKGKVMLQQGVCAHQGSHAPAYDTPSKSGGGSLLNKVCHPLGPALYLKQVEGILRGTGPIRPVKVSGVAMQVLKHQPPQVGEHFRVMQNVDDFARVTVVFEDETVAELYGYDLSISGIRNAFSVIADFGQYDMRINPNDGNELFLPNGSVAGNILMREKLPTPQGTSFPSPRQFHAHGYVNEMNDAVNCALNEKQYPQSGAMLAWDTLAILMAGYESAEKNSTFIDISDFTLGRGFDGCVHPDPKWIPSLLQRV